MTRVERRRAASLLATLAFQLVAVPLHVAVDHRHDPHHGHDAHHAATDVAAHTVEHTDAEDPRHHGHGPYSAGDHAVPMVGPASSQANVGHAPGALIGAPTPLALPALFASAWSVSDTASAPPGSGPPRGPHARAPPAA